MPIHEAIEYIHNKKFGKDSNGVLVICADEILELNSPVPGLFDLQGKKMSLAEVIMSQCMGLGKKARLSPYLLRFLIRCTQI